MEADEDRTLQLNFIESNDISKFYVADGVGFDKNAKGAWLDEFYAKNNNIKVGDTIKLTYDKETFEEKVLGLIKVPDHIYDIKDESSLFPNHIDYGFCYLSINEFPEHYIKKQVMSQMNILNEEIFDLLVKDFNAKDYLTFNYIMVDVNNEENKSSVKNEIEDNVKDALAITDFKDSFSYSTYQGEIDEGETYVGIFSGLFLFIAMLSVITTMTRVIKKQRVQIGTLKALGFKNRKITAHYVGYGFWISLVASMFGLLGGRYFIGNVFIGIEMSFFEIPNGVPIIKNDSYIVAILVILCVSFVTYLATRRILKETTAETLKNEIPKVKNNSLNITTVGIFKKMSFNTKWNIRDMFRNKARTITGIVGVTACAMLIVCSLGMLNSMNYFIDLQFNRIFNFDYKLSIKSDISNDEIKELTNEYGDNTSESLYIEIKDKDGNRESNNIFVTDSKDYVRFVDNKDKFIKLDNDDGIYVTYKLAETNGYKIGDKITWHIYGEDKYYETEIVGFDRDPQNQNVKMTRKYMESLGLTYKADTVYTREDLSNTKQIDGVNLIQDIKALEEGIASMLNTMKTMIILLIVVAALLGSVIIYNLGILSFTEKQYQFATLKVLGFKDKKIKNIYIKQNNWITVISIIIGLPIGYFMLDYIFKAALNDTYDFSAHIGILSYIYAIIGTFIVSYLTSKILARKVKKIDMVTSLKGNE